MNFLVLYLLFLGTTSWAMDVFNVGLRVNLEYSDLDHHCKLSALVRSHRLAVEVQDGEVIRGRVTKSSPFGPSTSLDLNLEEGQAIEIREEDDFFWIKSLSVSRPLLESFIFSGQGFGRDACVPPQGISSMGPDSVTFDFGVESVTFVLPHLIYSNEVVIRGQTLQGNPYRIKMSLTQDRT